METEANRPLTAHAKLMPGVQWQAERVRRYRRRVLGRRDPEDIHRLRVALRRLRVAIRLTRSAIRLPAGVTDRIVTATVSSLGRLRDAGVTRQLLVELGLVAKGGDVAVSERLVARLARSERRLLERARQSLRRGRVRRLLLALRRATRRPVALPFGEQPFNLVRPILLAAAWREVIDHSAWQLPPLSVSDRSKEPERLRHDLRIRIKELRYALELLADDPAEDAVAIGRLEQLAATLGEFRDLSKLHRELEKTPVLAAMVESRLTSVARRWNVLRRDWLALPPRLPGPPEMSGVARSEPSAR